MLFLEHFNTDAWNLDNTTMKYLSLSLNGHDATADEDNGHNDAPVSWQHFVPWVKTRTGCLGPLPIGKTEVGVQPIAGEASLPPAASFHPHVTGATAGKIRSP